MNDKARAGDQQACRKCTGARWNQQPATGADRYDDEHHFEPFEKHGLEAGERSKPIEPCFVPACLFAELCGFSRKNLGFVVERNDTRGAQDRLA